MRFDIFLTVQSADIALKFYIDELAMFEVRADYGMGCYLLHEKRNRSACLSIREVDARRSGEKVFGISVENCVREFERLRNTQFFFGGGIVPDDDGSISVFDYPIGKNFLMEDPDGNRFLLFEDYVSPELR